MKVTKKQLEDFVANEPYHMVVMYADWCGHCKDMKKRLGDKFRPYDIITFLEASDVEDELLDHFPHVHIYEHGKHRDGSMRDVYKLLEA